MDKIHRYLKIAAKKVADKSGKPLTIITSMAFLFACMVLLPLAELTATASLLINAAVAIVTLLLVLILAYAHGREIHALQARLDEFASELQTISGVGGNERLSPAEVRRIRTLLAEQANVPADDIRRTKRDERPSLF